MATLTFSPESETTQVTPNYAVRKFRFGNGYKQVQPEGINDVEYQVSTEFVFTDEVNPRHRPALAEWWQFLSEVKHDGVFDFDCPGLGVQNWQIISSQVSHRKGNDYSVRVQLESWNDAKSSALINTIASEVALIDPITVPINNAAVSAAFTIPLRANGNAPITSATVGQTTSAHTLVLQVKRTDASNANGFVWINSSSSIETATNANVFWSAKDLAPNVAAIAGQTEAVRLRFQDGVADTIVGGVEFRMG